MGLKQGLVYLESQNVTFSGTNMDLTGSIVSVNYNATGSITDSLGRYAVTNVGSPAVYGGFVQAGVAGPLLAATGSIVFGRQFSNETFVTTVTCQRSGTLFPYIVSGTGTYTVSGITIGGQSGLAYNWIAVGV